MAGYDLRKADRIDLGQFHPKLADGTPKGIPCARGCPDVRGSDHHCTVCHFTFTGLGLFDLHRRAGWCLDPEKLGLAEHPERPGVWGTPEGIAARQHATAQLRENGH